MTPERLAALEAYYSQNDDLYESHGAVLELIFEVKALQEEAGAGWLVVQMARHYPHIQDLAEAVAAYDKAARSWWVQPTVLALVAELRAARETAGALAAMVDHFADQEALAGSPLLRARQALAAYYEAARS